MDLSKKHTRRNILKTGLAAAATATLPVSKAKAQQVQKAQQYEVGEYVTKWVPKKPGELRITAVCENDPTLLRGLLPLSRIKNAFFWWAGDNRDITPQMIRDTDLLLTFYSSWFTQPEETRALIINEITKRGMGFMPVHNSFYEFTPYKELGDLVGAYAIMHREIQPITISKLNQNHPITKDIEPFIIPLDEQFGMYLVDPKDPDVTVLFHSQGLHDLHWTIQGIAAQRGKGRIVTMTPGHFDQTWGQPCYQEIMWRAAHWALNLPIEPFYGNLNNNIW